MFKWAKRGSPAAAPWHILLREGGAAWQARVCITHAVALKVPDSKHHYPSLGGSAAALPDSAWPAHVCRSQPLHSQDAPHAVLKTLHAGLVSGFGVLRGCEASSNPVPQVVGRQPRRPTPGDLELAFYNAAAASSPVTQGVKFFKGLAGGGKAK